MAVFLGDITYVPKKGAMKEILGSPEMVEALRTAANGIKTRADAMTPAASSKMNNEAYYVHAEIDANGMAEAAVVTGNPISMQDNLKNNTLLKAC